MIIFADKKKQHYPATKSLLLLPHSENSTALRLGVCSQTNRIANTPAVPKTKNVQELIEQTTYSCIYFTDILIAAS